MLLRAVAFLALVFQTVWVGAEVAIQGTGRTLTLGGVSYFVSPSPVSALHDVAALSVAAKSASSGLVPISVIPTSKFVFDSSALQDTINDWSIRDDVWTKEFLTGIYVTYNGTRTFPSTSLLTAQRSFGIDFVLLSQSYLFGVPLMNALPAGPYMLEPASGNIFEVFRLYNDENQSFVYGTIPDGNGGFQVLSARIPGAATETVGVPSRLYFTPTAEKPLAGMRLAVKDIYDVKGLRTGCGNRAFWQLYPPKEATAPAIQRLLNGGMVLVGKTKTSQFANGETATDDWVDLHAPYNPRGDGYQDGSSSSTGSGTAVAAYPWLDFAIGSDTGGSMRGPAGANGVFGNRPSHGAVLLNDVMPLSPELDTAGIFSRDARLWATAGHWWYENFTSFSHFPKKLLFPVDFFGSSYLTNPPTTGSTDDTFNTFITKLEGFLNTTRTEMTLAGSWNTTKPANVSAPSLQTLLSTTYADLITLDQIQLVADPFIADFGAANGGRTPFIDPAPLARWGYGRGLPVGRKEEALANKTIFMDWFSSAVVHSDATTCSDSILLYPQSSGRTNYRNRYISAPSAPLGFSSGRISVHAEVPDMVVPIGEAPFNSTITGRTEFLPVTISFIAAKGCDLMLFNLFAELQDAGIIRPVVTGSRMFT
ncbi:amidase signature enzyme [Lentinus tigrinus ALCF2SS1-7]|uniref:Amidase signature enzyme n=1 Tax=Lentinus tigrinus ALCF2SS1-6 TaxID=1328759 RepID=A0A5C2S8W0_9APHY|nr:amidase signature enzyme [Lentinus tigrinus ALCF2SS1-6]RPD71862.1 amidase signature enzyme [Lentinus tigrinus ALCF2SS1-7]